MKSTDLSIVVSVLQKLFNTFTHSLRESNNFDVPPDSELQLDYTIHKAIQQKIEELVPYLQDYDNNNPVDSEENKDSNKDDKVTLEGENDTTIIEFIPETESSKHLRLRDSPAEFKEKVKKYKKIRDKIKHALIKESISSKTQKLVTSTLDEMLAYMVRRKCPTDSDINNDIYRERLRTKAMAQAARDLTKNWSEQWNAIKGKHNEVWNQLSQQPNEINKMSTFFIQLQEFLTQIVNDTDQISNNYKIVCKLVKKDNLTEEVRSNVASVSLNLRAGNDNKKHRCPTFKVCSRELQRFMSHFFNNLNDTTFNAFRNYAAMYMTDITSDGSGERDTVIANVNTIGDMAMDEIKTIFVSEIAIFELDREKNKDKNMKRIKSYVENVIEKCVSSVKNYINSRIEPSLRSNLIKNLKEDLATHIDIDLGNLESETKETICRNFSSCNGMFVRRNFNGGFRARGQHRAVDKDQVYVKLQLTFDNKFKKKFARGDVDFLDNMLLKTTVYNRANIMTGITATRTTLADGALVEEYSTKDAKETKSKEEKCTKDNPITGAKELKDIKSSLSPPTKTSMMSTHKNFRRYGPISTEIM